MARVIARDLKPGTEVWFEGAWLPVLRASLTSEGVRVVYTDEGWYAMIPMHKVVRVK